MKRIWPVVKPLIIIVIFCILFLAATFIEVSLRARGKESILVENFAIPHAKVTAERMPDFLWVGTEWWINIDSPIPLELELDSIATAIIPSGVHNISMDHDYNNLSDYGLNFRGDFPSKIIVRPVGSSSAK